MHLNRTDWGNALHDQHIEFGRSNTILNTTYVIALAKVLGGFSWLKPDVEGVVGKPMAGRF